jgi:hypothetical protein
VWAIATLLVQEMHGWKAAVWRTMSLWLTVILLLLTRIESIGIQNRIRSTEPHFTLSLGSLFHFKLSAWLVVQITDIFGIAAESMKWKYQLLYMPFVVPFLVVSAVTVVMFRKDLPRGSTMLSPFAEGLHRCEMQAQRGAQ